MIFQHTHEWITAVSPHTGQPKTQTRRLAAGYTAVTDDNGRIVHVLKNGRLRWRVGGVYAVQPGRGRKAVAQVRLVAIRHEDVRTICAEDVTAEGFADKAGFLFTWTLMHDYSQHPRPQLDNLIKRPLAYYAAYVLKFELR